MLDEKNAPAITDERFPDGWVNFYRMDDYSAVSYFYLDKPVSKLPSLPSLICDKKCTMRDGVKLFN
ncbi:MAG: hypothetical protein WDO71_07075 [Bacteroidota bacterium]